jgi:hypothetical protein
MRERERERERAPNSNPEDQNPKWVPFLSCGKLFEKVLPIT